MPQPMYVCLLSLEKYDISQMHKITGKSVNIVSMPDSKLMNEDEDTRIALIQYIDI